MQDWDDELPSIQLSLYIQSTLVITKLIELIERLKTINTVATYPA